MADDDNIMLDVIAADDDIEKTGTERTMNEWSHRAGQDFKTSDVTIEEDTIEPGANPTVQHKTTKKGVIVARRSSDVLVRRPASTPLVAPREEEEVKVTRRSVSRQGSCVQRASRAQVVDEIGDTTKSVLKSVTRNDSNRRKVNELTKVATKSLNHHKSMETDSQTFKSRAFHAALKIAKAHNMVFVSGRPGSGKTHTAMDIVVELDQTFQDHKPIISSSPFDINYLEHTSMKSVVLLDDCFGKRAIDVAAVNYFIYNIEKVKTMLHKKQIVLVLTSSNDILEALRMNAGAKVLAFLDIDTHKVDLDGDLFKLTEQERLDQMTEYFNQATIGENLMKKLNSSVDANICLGFPLACLLSKAIHIDSLLKEPNEAVVDKLETMKNCHMSQFLLLALVLILDGKFPSSGLKSVDKKYFIRLTDMFPDTKCPYAEVQSTIPILKAWHFIAEDANNCLFIPHEIVFHALVITFVDRLDIKSFDLLPINVLNRIHFQYEDSEEEQLDCESICTKVISTTGYHTIAKLFFNSLATRSSEKFRSVAVSSLWEQNGFFDSVIDTCGIHFFFVTDVNDVPLSVFFVRCNRECVISRLGRCFTKALDDVLANLRPLIALTASEMITLKMDKGLSRFLSVCNTKDMSVVQAAIKSRDRQTIETVMNPMLSLQPSIGFLVQTACSSGHLDTLKFVFSKADKGMIQSFKVRKNRDGLMLVHFAAIGGDIKLLTFLEDHGFDLRAQTQDGSTILDVASMHGNISLVKSICSRFPDLIEMTNNDGFTCAHLAVREGYLETFRYLIELGVDPTFKVHEGNTIFHIAAVNGHTDILREISASNKYANIRDIPNDKSFSPQQLAATWGQLDVLTFFFAHGVDFNERTVDGRSFLHLAAFHGHMDVVEHLCINYQSLASSIDLDGNTAAHDAAAGGNLNVLVFLIKNFIDPRSLTNDDGTLMHEACYYGRFNVVKYLCSNFSDFENRVTSNGYSPCHAAALGGFVDIIDFLINNGADLLALTSDGNTILHEATFAGNDAVVRYILSRQQEMLHIPNDRSYLPGHFAAQEGHSDLLESLIRAMNGDLATTDEEQSYLHIASYNGQLEVVRILCKKYPELTHQQDANGAVPVHYAARGGHTNVFEYLLTQGADPISVTLTGSTVLHLAAFDGHMDTIKYLCDKFPALVQMTDDLDQTPLHYGAGCDNLNVLLYFIDKGLDPNARTSNGSTILLKAVFSGNTNVVKHICDSYPDMLPLTDDFGCNTLHYAASGGHLKCLRYLIEEKNADPFATTKESQTILHVAAYHGKTNIVTFLCGKFPSMKVCADSSGRTPEDFAKLGENVDIAVYLRSYNKTAGNVTVQKPGESRSVADDSGNPTELTTWQKFLAFICFCRSV